MDKAQELQERILERMDLSKETDDEELLELIHEVLKEESQKGVLSLREQTHLGKDLFNSLRKLDLLQELIEDEDITEIMINGTEHIFVEKEGAITELDKRFGNHRKLEDLIQQIVAGSNRLVNESIPIADARLADGSRVNVVLPPVALNGPIVTIRKFPKENRSMEDLVSLGALSDEVAKFLQVLMASKYNIFVSGGTGSGKTTFLNALSDFIPKEERIITIEDNAELRICGVPNLVRMEARSANVEGTGEITIRDLLKASLRMRPSRIIVGEVRGGEAIDMLQSLNTGHAGASTGHANSPEDMLSRLETMVLMGMEIPLEAIRRQIASAIDIIVHLGRLRDKSRKVLKIVEITGFEKGEVRMQTLYEFQEQGVYHGKIQGTWEKRGTLQGTEKLLAAGYSLEGISMDAREGHGNHGAAGSGIL